MRAAVELAMEWRSDKVMQKLEAMLIVMNDKEMLVVSGTGEVIAPDDGILAIGSGGLFGLGLGSSRQKFYYLPEQHTDFIFAILGEELGFLGSLAVLALFFLFAWRGFRIAMKANDLFGSFLAVGITSMIVVQAALNIGVVSGVLPVTGVTLPFISFGSSSLVVSLAGVGVLLNISKRIR